MSPKQRFLRSVFAVLFLPLLVGQGWAQQLPVTTLPLDHPFDAHPGAAADTVIHVSIWQRSPWTGVASAPRTCYVELVDPHFTNLIYMRLCFMLRLTYVGVPFRAGFANVSQAVAALASCKNGG